ncbi:hypothetical protein CRYUN_Cryun06bG0170800 [Craigia yunnanensis]
MAAAPSPLTSIYPSKAKANGKITKNEPINPPENPPSLLSKCTSLKELKQIQAFAIKTHLQNDLNALTKLINFCTNDLNVSYMPVVIMDLWRKVGGHLDEAYKFIDELSIKPTPILWRTLLAACSSHDDVELGKRVIERIFELDDSFRGDFVILSNLCARVGRWEDVDFLRKLMKDIGVVKVPGCSSIEVDNIVHEFFSGDGWTLFQHLCIRHLMS